MNKWCNSSSITVAKIPTDILIVNTKSHDRFQEVPLAGRMQMRGKRSDISFGRRYFIQIESDIAFKSKVTISSLLVHQIASMCL